MKQPETVSITLTIPEVDIVLQSMGQRPYDLVVDLINRVRRQVLIQIEEFNQAQDKDEAPKGEGP